MFLDPTSPSGRQEYSDETAAAIDEEVSKILERAHERVREILVTRRAALDAIAHRLLEREVIDGDELRRLAAAAESEKATA